MDGVGEEEVLPRREAFVEMRWCSSPATYVFFFRAGALDFMRIL